jgi:hypothetical protein
VENPARSMPSVNPPHPQKRSIQVSRFIGQNPGLREGRVC